MDQTFIKVAPVDNPTGTHEFLEASISNGKVNIRLKDSSLFTFNREYTFVVVLKVDELEVVLELNGNTEFKLTVVHYFEVINPSELTQNNFQLDYYGASIPSLKFG